MLSYRGFRLIEFVVIHSPGHIGPRRGGVAIYDDAVGTLCDQPDMEAAKRWIDLRIAEADRMLAKVLR